MAGGVDLASTTVALMATDWTEVVVVVGGVVGVEGGEAGGSVLAATSVEAGELTVVMAVGETG